MVDKRTHMCYSCQMFLKRYDVYPNDLGQFVIWDNEFDLMLAICGNQTIARVVVDALNDYELEQPDCVTKLH